MLDVVSFSAGPSLHSCQVSKWHRCAAVTHRHGLRVQLARTVPVGGCEAGYLSARNPVRVCVDVPLLLGSLLIWGIKHARWGGAEKQVSKP